MSTSGVDTLHDEFSSLITLLDVQMEPSLRASVESNFRRSLLLAAASYFESRMILCVLAFAEEVAGPGSMLVEFVRVKGVERQYHAWFEWKENNATKFFALFGAEFKSFMKAKLKTNVSLEVAVSSFMEIGRNRNRLVHGDFASFSLEKTTDDIYAAYKSGMSFVEAMPALLREGLQSRAAPTNAD